MLQISSPAMINHDDDHNDAFHADVSTTRSPSSGGASGLPMLPQTTKGSENATSHAAHSPPSSHPTTSPNLPEVTTQPSRAAPSRNCPNSPEPRCHNCVTATAFGADIGTHLAQEHLNCHPTYRITDRRCNDSRRLDRRRDEGRRSDRRCDNGRRSDRRRDDGRRSDRRRDDG